MQKRFNLILTSLLILLLGLTAFAQDQVEFKDVLLDGKPAKLNVATGEITLIKLEDKVVETKTDSVKITPVIITDSHTIKTSDVLRVENDEVSDFHIVKEGENLFRLSRHYNTSLAALKKANNLETTLIKKGQKLRVRNLDQVSESKNPSIWIVKSGDNLYRIALKNGISVETIKKLNGLASDVIHIGQKLQLN